MAATRIDFLQNVVIAGSQLDLSMHVGDDYSVTVFFKDANDVDIDITGWVLKSAVHDEQGTEIVELVATITDATGGEVELTSPRATTELLEGYVGKKNTYDFFAIDGANKRRKWFFGLFEVSGSITDE